jgi:hypothetical protein
VEWNLLRSPKRRDGLLVHLVEVLLVLDNGEEGIRHLCAVIYTQKTPKSYNNE